jgi:hypothetical protein
MPPKSLSPFLLQMTGTDKFIDRFGEPVGPVGASRFSCVTDALNWVRRNDISHHITLVREEIEMVPRTHYVPVD